MQDQNGIPEIKGVAADIACDRFTDEGWAATSVYAPSEMEMTIYINHRELVTILCTPTKLNCLVVGFLATEGIISGLGDVMSMRVCEDESLTDVMLANQDYQPPTLRTLTSGCGGGSTFRSEAHAVDSALTMTPEEILALMKQLQERMELYRLSGGVHTSALADDKGLLIVTEDIGRHNTLDKIQGEALLRNVATKDRVILTTGRVSSEMLVKAAKMEAPVVVSRHTPTARAISLARELNITLAGHVRANSMMVYSHPVRLGRPADEIGGLVRPRRASSQKNLMR